MRVLAIIGFTFWSGVLSFPAFPSYPQTHAAQTTHWKKYRNEKFDFTVEYPTGWKLSQGFDGSGATITPGGTRFPKSTVLGVGGWVVQPSSGDESHPKTLDKDLASLIDAIAEPPLEGHNARVVKQHKVVIDGLDGLDVTINYDDKAGKLWMRRELLLHSAQDAVAYHVSIAYLAKEAAPADSIFARVVSTFHILGPPL
ncbi:MAG TPA: hypothetical protein VIY69_04140 [Candidatus Acidoferrales bacterium]